MSRPLLISATVLAAIAAFIATGCSSAYTSTNNPHPGYYSGSLKSQYKRPFNSFGSRYNYGKERGASDNLHR